MTDLIQISTVEGEARILDTELAARLGFSNPIDIRKTVRRHRDSLARMGTVATVATVRRGQNAEEFYLNRKQAIFITAKSETEQATDITIEIIHRFDEYERGLIGSAVSINYASDPRSVAGCFRNYHDVAKLIGLDRNQAALSAARATRVETGIDPLERLGVTHLLSPRQEALLTPTDIGKRLGGKSAIAVNHLLQEMGLQIGRRDLKDKTYWEPTSIGAPHAVFLDTGKKHSDGTPVRQLKWNAGVIAALEAQAVNRKVV